MLAASLLAFFTGFLSLSLEILWIRLFGFANHTLPQAFAFVLTLYLIGIALGARVGKNLCTESSTFLWKVSGIVLVVSSFFDLISPWYYAYMGLSQVQVITGGFLILLSALLKAIVFPIAHHLGASISGPRIGRAISTVYVSNIMGATVGPILTGMILLDVFNTQTCFLICAGLSFIVGFCCLLKNTPPQRLIAMCGMAALVFGFAAMMESTALIRRLAEPVGDVRRIVENKHGIITLYKGGKGGDIVYGANVYDGRTNLSPVINSNNIHRVLVLSALHDKPERVLIIGLSIGTWLKLVTLFPDVKQIDVVEINPGYLAAMQDYPRQQSALLDPRVHVYVDDGRRWLRTHPENAYDMVIMNTTYFWRAYTTNLLSREFLALIQRHMKPHAIIAYNTTSSPDVFKTAVTVFSYAYLYENFVIAADFDWRQKLHGVAAAKKLLALRLDGESLFTAGGTQLVQKFLDVPCVSYDALQAKSHRLLEVVTDRNLITEYKYGRGLGV